MKMILMLLSVLTAASAQAQTLTIKQTQAIAEVIQPERVSLWLELNAPWWTLERTYQGRPLPGPPTRTLLEHTVLTLKAWEPTSRYAVVTSKHGAAMAQTYPTLRSALPNMEITGGLKTWPYTKHGYPYYGLDVGYDWLADPNVWTQFAADAKQVIAVTGVKHIVVMAEGPMRGFYAGHVIDGKRVYYTPKVSKAALKPLRDLDCRVTWYPFGPHLGRTMAEGLKLVSDLKAAVPKSEFTTVGDGWPSREGSDEMNRRRDALRATGVTLHHHLFVTGSGRWTWQDGDSRSCYDAPDFISWQERRGFTDVWLFPGGFESATMGMDILIPELFLPEVRASTPSELAP